jgi:hypothetical protein
VNKLFVDRVRGDRVTGGQVNKLLVDRVKGRQSNRGTRRQGNIFNRFGGRMR